MDAKRDSETEERRKAAWIGQSVLVKGDVVSTGDLIIDGQIEGTIKIGEHNLTIGQGATVIADLTAGVVSISGKVKGNVTGLTAVALRATGSVEGNIAAPKFVMEDGAALRGRVDAGGKK